MIRGENCITFAACEAPRRPGAATLSDVSIRPANDADAPALAEIYNHYIATSTATFDTEPKTAEERRAWLAARSDRHPVFVAQRDGAVIGFGALTQWSARPAWGDTVEVAVYLSDGETGRGLGGLLLKRLIAAAREVGHHALIAQVVGDNGPSLAIMEREGFTRVGTLREVGYKFGSRLDVVLLELIV
jgi:phosphinothricin acetyltransferase